MIFGPKFVHRITNWPICYWINLFDMPVYDTMTPKLTFLGIKKLNLTSSAKWEPFQGVTRCKVESFCHVIILNQESWHPLHENEKVGTQSGFHQIYKSDVFSSGGKRCFQPQSAIESRVRRSRRPERKAAAKARFRFVKFWSPVWTGQLFPETSPHTPLPSTCERKWTKKKKKYRTPVIRYICPPSSPALEGGAS